MKALVTGASGFIGSTLIEELGRQGLTPVALMRRSSSSVNLKDLEFQQVEGDLADESSLRKAVRDVDLIFHLAGSTAAPNRDAYFESNARGTERLARVVAEEAPRLKRFVYVSSLAAAGPASSLQPKVEAELEAPVSFYGKSKLAGEHELLRYRDRLPITIVRPPMVYGPKDKGVFVIIQTLAKNWMPILQGANPEGQKYYSAIHAEDLARGLIQAGLNASAQVPSGEIFYLASDEVHSYQEFLQAIAASLGCRPRRISVPKWAVSVAATGAHFAGLLVGKTFPLNLDKLNEILPDYWICSSAKARQQLGFSSKFSLAEGMAQTIAWYRQNGWIKE